MKSALENGITGGFLSHALLICGEKGLGVNYFARLLAGDILNTENIEDISRGKNPLVQIIHGEGAMGQIKIEKIRQINENVNFSSIQGDKRVVIIENCENFNTHSANALLKNLEEPKDDITYILTTLSAQRILPTIRSRCSVYTLASPDRQQVREYFAQTGQDEAAAEKLLKIYGANIGKIKACLEDGKRFDILQNTLAVFDRAKKGDGYAVSKICYGYVKNKDGFKLLLGDLIDLCRQNLSEKTAKIIKVCEDYTDLLNTNVNMNLCVENFSVDVTK